MRYFSPPAVAALVSLLSLANSSAQAQTSFASDGYYASTKPNNSISVSAYTPTPVSDESVGSMVLWGRISTPAGVLPGAVIILTASKQMTVTNADGEFQFVVPANTGPLQARVTYAGYADEVVMLNAAADESQVNLTSAQGTVVSRKQQFSTYLKTARKELKRTLKQVRKEVITSN